MIVSFWNPDSLWDMQYLLHATAGMLETIYGISPAQLDVSEVTDGLVWNQLSRKRRKEGGNQHGKPLWCCNCGNRRTMQTCVLLQQSDIIVIAIKEFSRKLLEEFYNQMPIRVNKVLLFIENVPDGTIQTQHIEYGIIPYNPFFFEAFKRGKFMDYLKKNLHTPEFGVNERYLKEFEKTIKLLRRAILDAAEKENIYERSF